MKKNTIFRWIILLTLVLNHSGYASQSQPLKSAGQQATIDELFVLNVPLLRYSDAAGSSEHAIVMELTPFLQSCDVSLGQCSFDDELIWEVTQSDTQWAQLNSSEQESEISADIIEQCRAQTQPTLNANWQLCIPELHILNSTDKYWLLMNFDASLPGRDFFRLQESGLTSDPKTPEDITSNPDQSDQYEPPQPSVVEINWPLYQDIDDGGEVRQQSHDLMINVNNTSTQTLLIEPQVLLDIGTDQNLGQYLMHYMLPAGDSERIVIDLDQFGYAFDAMQFSGSVNILLNVIDQASGQLLESVSAPTLFWHQDSATNDVVIYGEQRMITTYHAGDFNQTIADDDLFEPGVIVERVVSGEPLSYINSDVIYLSGYESLDSVGDAFEPDETEKSTNMVSIGPMSEHMSEGQAVRGSYNIRTCAKWRFSTTDSGRVIQAGFPSAGQTEDYWTSCDGGCNAKARGVLMRLKVGAFSKTAYAHPTSGCVNWSVNPIFDNTFDLRVYTKSRDANGNYLRVHNSPNSFKKYAGKIYARDFKNIKLFNGTRTFNVGDTTDAKWSTVAAASFGLYRYHDGLSNKLINLGVDYGVCGGSSAHFGKSNNYLTKGRQYLKVGAAKNFCGASDAQGKMKLIVTHEMGHSLAALYYANHDNAVNGDEPNVDINHSTFGDACDFNGGSSYTINSKEWNSVGFREGFAHFIAAKMWNNKQSTGAFNWFRGRNDLESFNAANTPGGRLGNVCGSNKADKAVIGDWMRFLWDLYTNTTNNCAIQPTKLDMLKLYRATRLKSPSRDGYYLAMKQAASEIGLASCLSSSAFDFYADHNGIDF